MNCAFGDHPLAGDDTDELVALINGAAVYACFECAVQVESGEPLIARKDDT